MQRTTSIRETESVYIWGVQRRLKMLLFNDGLWIKGIFGADLTIGIGNSRGKAAGCFRLSGTFS